MIRINEIRTDQPGADTDEYFELVTRVDGASLSGLTYLVIGDGPGGSGQIEAVVDLMGQAFVGGDPFYLVAEDSFSLGGVSPDLIRDLNFENSDNVTHLLVEAFSGQLGDDLDADDDGVLDAAPWMRVVDAVALVEVGGPGDFVYAESLGFSEVHASGFVPGHVFRVQDSGHFQIGNFAPGVSDTPGALNVVSGGGLAERRTISEIQGTGMVSPLEGRIVQTSGVVVADFQGLDELRGFYLQDAIGDGDAATSDGLFIYDPEGKDVSVGDRVTVTGRVIEFNGLTEISRPTSVLVDGKASVAPTEVFLPETVNNALERFEGMLVRIVPRMTVSQNFFLGRYGQLTLASPDDGGIVGRLFQPTQIFPPGAAAETLADENQRRLLVLDDGRDVSAWGDHPRPVPYLEMAPMAVIRVGDQVSDLVGVLDYGRINSQPSSPARDYRLHPTQVPRFISHNPRPVSVPVIGGNLKVASFNVLNYFVTLKQRGADTFSELARQRAKIVSALVEIDADILGLIELENDSGAAAQDLVDTLNAVLGAGTYARIETGVIGSDAIQVGLLFKPGSVAPVGPFRILNNTVDPAARDEFNRPALLQSFRADPSGDILTVVVNHWKSKGRPCDEIGDPDRGDGQGNCNGTRTSMARALARWLASDPTGSGDPDFLLIGDLNAYAKEDPVQALEAAGFVNVVDRFRSQGSYTYVFDGQAGSLDHAMASPSLVSKIVGVREWPINADEAPIWDYNEEWNPAGFFEPNEFRSSDHDPVIVGLQMGTGSVSSPLDERSMGLPRVRFEDGRLRLFFDADPEGVFQVQFTRTLTDPVWQTLAVVVADARGQVEFVYSAPAGPMGFFRLQAR